MNLCFIALSLGTAPQCDDSVESQPEAGKGRGQGQGHRQNQGHKHKERQKQKLRHSGIAPTECPRPVQLEALNGRHLELVNKQSAALIVAD